MALALAWRVAAAGEPCGAALTGVQRWLDGTHDLQASFRQAVLSGALGVGPEESGRVYVARPGRMRWDYLEPERKVAIVEGDRTRLYLAEDAELWEGSLDPTERLLPELLAGTRRLDALFDCRPEAGPTGEASSSSRLALVPLAPSSAYERVTLEIDPKQFTLRAIEVLDAAGNRIRYDLSRIRRNAGLADDLFDFDPPPGTEIVARP